MVRRFVVLSRSPARSSPITARGAPRRVRIGARAAKGGTVLSVARWTVVSPVAILVLARAMFPYSSLSLIWFSNRACAVAGRLCGSATDMVDALLDADPHRLSRFGDARNVTGGRDSVGGRNGCSPGADSLGAPHSSILQPSCHLRSGSPFTARASLKRGT